MSEGLENSIHMEVFLIYEIGAKYQRSDINALFSEPILNVDEHVCDKPIFFDENNALNYMRFIDSTHCILHVYLPESAIEGHFDGLYLKKGSFSQSQIHGCYPSYAKGKEYIENPSFNTHLFSLTVTAKEDLL